MKQISIMLIAALLFLSAPGSIYASMPAVQSESSSVLRYTIINSIASGLFIDSSGKSTCYGRLVSGSSGSDCYIIMELQQKSGNKWSTVKTWTTSKLNGTSVSIEKDYYVVQGTYRVKVTGTVENSDLGGEETAVKYSKTVEY